jgi:Secretory lipase
MRVRVVVAGLLLAGLLGCTAVVAAAAGAGAAKPPGSDPFYVWKGPLTKVAPGHILRRRQVTLSPAIGGVSTATQVLYRTTTQLGAPTVTVATIIRPAQPSAGSRIVSYQTAYDALGAQCDPSYTLAGGNGSFDSAETSVMGLFVANGDTVVVSDYEGEDLAFGAGQQSGYQTLDGIRATERVLGAPSSTPVGLIGYSGGSIASEFASEVARKYAPKLNIAGVAEGGIPVDLAHNLRYVNGSPVWSSATPGILVGTARAYGIKLGPLLSSYGRTVLRAVSHQCLSQYLGKYPGLRVATLFKAGYKDYDKVPAFATATNDLIMGRSGTPKGPLLMGVGNADGTGDGVMVARDVAGLAHQYCKAGVSVQFKEYVGDDHTQAAGPFLLAAVPFLQARLQRTAVANGCASVPKGNALTPLPVPRYTATLGSRTRRGFDVTLRARGGTVLDAVVTLTRGARRVQTVRLARLSSAPSQLVLKLAQPGRYSLTLSQAGVQLWQLPIRIREAA